ncbi:DUF4011 domain-containing protein [Mycolicibacterium monacense]|uniref:DUF4011 domain-containing protein n=1 Tax=Mycolicibacterium monacense TaxID=85693 RepID=UPI0007E99ACB|nr:DUF4011 domain-containing protein [Mycolicibacterium monacense]OBF48777.1 hypothetical protein A5778_22410 [Mycolicibacterium monacense]
MSENAIWPAHVIERHGLRIDVHAQPAVNLALIHNRVPLVTEIAVTNESDVPVSGLHLSVRLHGSDGEIAPKWSRSLAEDLPPGDTHTWNDLGDVIPDVEHLKHLNESYPGAIVVSAEQRFKDDIVHRIPLQVLAHNEWFNAPIFYDSLAAFVQPNTRAVRKILEEASDILQKQTSSASLDAYQRGPERAALIAAAVYEALRARSIRYISPPASFENTGQKVRTTAQVLDERFGTCIDLAVTYAACIEQTGLHPLIWLVDGHAFTGFMLNEESLAHTSLTETNTMVNLFESNRAIAVEAIYYEQGPEGSFRSAVEAARRHFANPASLRAVIDVSTARRDGVRPLPTAFDDTPEEEKVEQTASTSALLDLPPELKGHASGDTVLDVADTSPARVKKWKRSLLDLSTRNRLLNLRPSAQVVDLVVPAKGLAMLDDLVHNGKRVSLAAHNDLSSIYRLQGARTAQDIDPASLLEMLQKEKTAFVAVGEEAYARRFKRLQRDARTLLEETGASNLYLTFGSLVHTTSTGAEARAPLFLLPVQLVGGTGNSAFEILIDSTNVATTNHCLVEWLRLKHNVNIPALSTPPLDDSGIDIDAALVAIRNGLVENRLPFRIDETAVLAICQFGTFGMWKDLSDSWEILSQSPLVDHLTHRPGESFIDGAFDAVDLDGVQVDETAEPTPIHADGSQLRAIELSSQGRTFVLEGPPGTGKSQTITNLIARNLAAGRSVLFVAEKQAALEVVKKRLDAIGLKPFTLDLHGRNQSVVEVRNQLRESIEFRADYNERVWDARLAEFRSKHAPLAEYPERIHSQNVLGDSLWAACETVLSLGNGSSALISDAHPASTTPEQFSANRDALRLFTRTVRPGDCRPNNPWSLAGDPQDDDSIRAAARELDAAFKALQSNATALDVLTSCGSAEDVTPLLERATRELTAPPVPNEEWRRFATADWERFVAGVLTQTSQLQATWAGLISTFNPVFLARGDHAVLVQLASEVPRGLFGRKKREEQFARSLAAVVLPNVTLTAEEATPLLSSVPSARDHSAHIEAQMRQALGPLAPAVWDPLSPNAIPDLQEHLDYIRSSIEFSRRHPLQWRILRSGVHVDQPVIDVLSRALRAWDEWTRALGAGTTSTTAWQGDATWLEAWARDHESWIAELDEHGPDLPRRIARASAALAPLRQPGLEAFVAGLLDGSIAAGQAEFEYLAGAAQASMRERLKAHHLDGFDPHVRSGETADFNDVAMAVRREQSSALPARIMRQRNFRVGELKGKIGELRRQLDLRRQGKSVRRLMEDYGPEILSATPCFFVSPASLAQFVPPGSVTFDLVVFDEASQITVAQAIGALGRGRSAIIVGDSQQMPPTAFGQVTTNRDDEDDAEEEVVPEDLDSILTECVESSVPRIWLSWHYRSRDESLIAFSNEKYYEGKLASLPAPGGNPATGLELRRVDGHFNREDKKKDFRTNRVEAEAIVAEIRSLVHAPSGTQQSIGVVTFNRQQQELILDLLEATGDQQIIHLLKPDTENGIFVKNLENVQGDERDVILFSTAFSKRPGDGAMPLNFGPLTRFGGEKRLNVAVTRARSKVIVFSSFDPSDIELSRTRSVGMAHLKAYLEAAASASGQGGVPSVSSGQQPEKLQETIAAALQERGLDVAVDYGLSEFVVDIAVRDPQSPHWQVAVMLDGPRWARRATVADRELTPSLLDSMMGWSACERVWLPEWIKDPDSVVDRISSAVEQAKADEAKRAEEQAALLEKEPVAKVDRPITPPVETPAASTDPVPDTERPMPLKDSVQVDVVTPVTHVAASNTAIAPTAGRGIQVPYVAAPTTPVGSRDELDRPQWESVRTRIQDAVRESIEIEGPIALNRLVRNVVHRFGFDRAAAKRQEVVRQFVPVDLIYEDELGCFVWPSDLDRHAWPGFRTTPSGFARPLDEIAGEEIINALVYAARNGVYDQEQLMRDTLAFFDQSRLTKQSADRLESCIVKAERLGKLVRRGAGYVSAT